MQIDVGWMTLNYSAGNDYYVSHGLHKSRNKKVLDQVPSKISLKAKIIRQKLSYIDNVIQADSPEKSIMLRQNSGKKEKGSS